MEIGALWLKEKDGKKFFSGQIEYPGVKLNFAIFKNDKKEKDNQPDYKIIWSPPKNNHGSASGNTPDENPFPDDSPPF